MTSVLRREPPLGAGPIEPACPRHAGSGHPERCLTRATIRRRPSGVRGAFGCWILKLDTGSPQPRTTNTSPPGTTSPVVTTSCRCGYRAFCQTEMCDVLSAVNVCTVPVGPAFDQRHPGDPRHQVVLGGPRVSVRRVERLGPSIAEVVVVRDQTLVDHVVLVEAEVPLGHVERYERLTGSVVAAGRARRPRSRSARRRRDGPLRCGSTRPARPASAGS